MEYRCVKCGENHTPGECSIKKEDPKECLRCVLCNEKGHPASYKGCPEFQRRLKTREDLRSTLKEKIINRHALFSNVQPRLSFANVVRNNTSSGNGSISNTNTLNNNNDTNILKEISNNIIALQQKFVNIEKKLSEHSERIDYIFEMYSVFSNHST